MESWEKEFEKRFEDGSFEGEEILRFIRSQLSAQKQRMVEILDGMERVTRDMPAKYYNDALRDAKSQLENL